MNGQSPKCEALDFGFGEVQMERWGKARQERGQVQKTWILDCPDTHENA